MERLGSIVDITGAAGKMKMGMLSAFAKFERDLLIERTQAGLSRAKVEGKALGHPSALTGEEHKRCSPVAHRAYRWAS